MPEILTAGLGEIVLANRREVLLCATGLGSCVALCVRETNSGACALAHVVLPGARASDRLDYRAFPWRSLGKGLWVASDVGKYAPVAVEAVLARLSRCAETPAFKVALVGGANVLQTKVQSESMDIGKRNVAALLQTLQRHSLRPCCTDVGDTFARSVVFDTSTAEVSVKPPGKDEYRLGVLGRPLPSPEKYELSEQQIDIDLSELGL